MASLAYRTCSNILRCGILQRANVPATTQVANYASNIDDALKINEAPQVSEVSVLKPDEVKMRKQLEGTITIKEQENITSISGIPQEHIKTRRVRIYVPPKNAMQSGTDNINFWQMEFDNRQRWENPLMGWTSTGDPHSNVKLEFSSKEEAIAHCEKNGWQWFVQEPNATLVRPKNYGINFAWNKRTRVSTK